MNELVITRDEDGTYTVGIAAPDGTLTVTGLSKGFLLDAIEGAEF